MSLREDYESILDEGYSAPNDDYDYWESGPPATWDDEPEPPPSDDEAMRLSDYNAQGNW